MRPARYLSLFMVTALLFAGTACNKFVVKNVDYSHKIESVLTPDETGSVTDVRHGISFNINPFLKQEFGEDSSHTVDEVRLIRDSKGYYFITANDFKHVYVMEPEKSELKLENRIKVSDSGLNAPAFNMRDTMVQLIQSDSNTVVTLSAKGKIKQEEQS
ncbi:hypothetical protein [Gracilimonas mengyeensis]|nr:hypothetical protein [Gracilimonas mengyeensis]